MTDPITTRNNRFRIITASKPYLFALSSVIVAFVFRLLLDPFLGDLLPYGTFILAVAFVAWKKNLGPALFASASSGLIAEYFFVSPRSQFVVKGIGNELRLGVYFIVAFFIAFLVHWQRRKITAFIETRERLLIDEQAREREVERSQAEEKLRRSEENLRLLFEQAPDGIFITDANGRYLDVNRAGEQLLGYTVSELRTMGIADLLTPEEIVRLPSEIDRLVDGNPVISEWRFKRKDGRIHDGELVARRLPDGRMQGILRNITDRKRAEELLLRLSRLYLVLSRVNESILHIRDLDELFVEVCKIAVEDGQLLMAWVGIVDEETKWVKPVAHWGDEQGYLKRFQISAADIPQGRVPTGTAIREGRYKVCQDLERGMPFAPVVYEVIGRGYRSNAAIPINAAGRTIGAVTFYSGEIDFFTDDNIRLLQNLAENLGFAIESSQEAAKRRLAEEALQSSDARLRLSIAAANIGLWIWDLETNNAYFSPEWKQQLGYTDDEIPNQFSEWEKRVHPDDLGPTLERLHEYFN